MSRSKRFEQREDRVTTKNDKKNQNRSERKQRKASIADQIALEEEEELLDFLEVCGDYIDDEEFERMKKKVKELQKHSKNF